MISITENLEDVNMMLPVGLENTRISTGYYAHKSLQGTTTSWSHDVKRPEDLIPGDWAY